MKYLLLLSLLFAGCTDKAKARAELQEKFKAACLSGSGITLGLLEKVGASVPSDTDFSALSTANIALCEEVARNLSEK